MDRTRPPLVLVIEDDQSLRALYRNLFENEGWRVAAVPSPDSHLGWVRVYAPEAVVLDLDFDGKADDGIRFLRRLRADGDGKRIPVAVCTGSKNLVHRHQDEIARLEATILPKPFNLGDLLRAVNRPPAGA